MALAAMGCGVWSWVGGAIWTGVGAFFIAYFVVVVAVGTEERSL